VIPVFIDETEDADHVLSQSAFEPVWQVLKALRAHDRRLADELDQLRLSLGRQSKPGGRISLPDNIHLDVPRLLLRDFEQAFYVRTVEQTTEKPSLTIEQILAWADEYKAATGEWPTRGSGQVPGTDETWARIDNALKRGGRTLPRGSSLANVLAEHRGVRNIKDLPSLAVEQILGWIDDYKEATGEWPTRASGQITGRDETWSRIDSALWTGLRGLPGGSSLAKLLAEHRGLRNMADLPSLTIDQILSWADAHNAATGRWPTTKSGLVPGTNESWLGIDRALRRSLRGLAGGSSLAKLLRNHRSVRNPKELPQLTIDQILGWVDEYKAATGHWPTTKSGYVVGTGETWAKIGAALFAGVRGLPGGSSLARLLAERRGVRNNKGMPKLTLDQILAWADAHKAATGAWPTRKSGPVTGTNETWARINTALVAGLRGLSRGSSLAKLLAEQRGVRNIQGLPTLTIEQILGWVDDYKAAMGSWPNPKSGAVTGTDETWSGIQQALFHGGRGLPCGSSLAKLLAEHRGVRNFMDLPPLTVEQITAWAEAHKARTGNWLSKNSGQVAGTDETWGGINFALTHGRRGLPAGSSLAKLLGQRRERRTV
jgi:hypothetical protein